MATIAPQLVLPDLFAYTNVPFVQSHPDRIATTARLAGLRPAPVDRCRVLEVGCGPGANILGMAYTLPGSTFLGLDFGSKAINDANEVIAALGLKNVRCVQQNLLDFDPAGETFDYVIAHGFYTWVPQVVRDKLMAVIAQVLAPNGVAYVSYNVYPGSYSAQRLRDFSLLHRDTLRTVNPAAVQSPKDEVEQTYRLIEILRDNFPSTENTARTDLFFEAKRTSELLPGIIRPLIFHDVIADHWDPCTLQQFVAHADLNGLQFIGEATPAETDLPTLSEPLGELIRESARGDRILELQYADYLTGREFRRSLICRKELALAKEDEIQEVAGMFVGTQMRESNTGPDGSVAFEIPGQVSMSTPASALIRILRRLISAYPRRVAVQEFEGGDAESNRHLYGLFLRMYRGGSVDLYTQPSPAGPPTDKPFASALARYQSRRQELFGNLLHQGIELENEDAVWFLNLLDGTRDRDALLEEAVRRFPDRARGDLVMLIASNLDTLRTLGLLQAQH